MYYTGVVKNMCPMCGRTVYLKVTEDKQDEYDCYSTEYPSKSIQSALPSFDKFEREFIKTGYCVQNCLRKMGFSVWMQK